jgi:hypothetical protein
MLLRGGDGRHLFGMLGVRIAVCPDLLRNPLLSTLTAHEGVFYRSYLEQN